MHGSTIKSNNTRVAPTDRFTASRVYTSITEHAASNHMRHGSGGFHRSHTQSRDGTGQAACPRLAEELTAVHLLN